MAALRDSRDLLACATAMQRLRVLASGSFLDVGYIASMTNTSRSQGSLLSLILRRGREERLAQTAGGLTFTIVVSMVPLLAVSFAVFARTPALRAAGEAIREHLLRGLLPADIAKTALKHLA